ncbi:hypothetical protein EDD37DRAFT_66284 [Exophiala viscosa]|uniref:C2H2-type domain-containing protein n=1 Tax=Exophiala viscosa TaxID=2486360 RepID=A0AAN6IGZ8_9EURO|nr:hypothetical protein EDD36DRAFT_415605 [Exophiala viscosa]KAI1629723.1 hypothetical protein EDD37DRAFT_66284 [Exophiala viscosa]
MADTVKQCPMCQKRLGADPSNFRRHQRRCQGVRYPCGICHRQFSRRDNLKRHIEAHKEQANPGAGGAIPPANANGNGQALPVADVVGASQQPQLAAAQTPTQRPAQEPPVLEWAQVEPVLRLAQVQPEAQQHAVLYWPQVQHPVQRRPVPEMSVPAQAPLGVQDFDLNDVDLNNVDFTAMLDQSWEPPSSLSSMVPMAIPSTDSGYATYSDPSNGAVVDEALPPLRDVAWNEFLHSD